MSRQQMRIDIAKDVLAMLRKAPGVPSVDVGCGQYFVGKSRVDDKDDVRSYVQQVECRVCALGAMFVAEVDRNNQLRFSSLGFEELMIPSLSRYTLVERLKLYFDVSELAFIENVFEGDRYHTRMPLHWHEITPSLRLDASDQNILYRISHHFLAKDLLETMMRHIVEHEGEISAEELLDYLIEVEPVDSSCRFYCNECAHVEDVDDT